MTETTKTNYGSNNELLWIIAIGLTIFIITTLIILTAILIYNYELKDIRMSLWILDGLAVLMIISTTVLYRLIK